MNRSCQIRSQVKLTKANTLLSGNIVLTRRRLNLAFLCFKKLTRLIQSVENHLYIYLISITELRIKNKGLQTPALEVIN